MKKPQFTETQIVSIPKQADAGIPVKDLCRDHGISSVTTASGNPSMAAWKAAI